MEKLFSYLKPHNIFKKSEDNTNHNSNFSNTNNKKSYKTKHDEVCSLFNSEVKKEKKDTKKSIDMNENNEEKSKNKKTDEVKSKQIQYLYQNLNTISIDDIRKITWNGIPFGKLN